MMTRTAFRTQRTARKTKPIRIRQKTAAMGVVDQHRDLEVDRFLAVRVKLGDSWRFISQMMSGGMRCPGK